MSYITPEHRYQTDPVFRRVVDLLTAVIDQAELSPYEVREAAKLAAIHYEMRTTRRLYPLHGDVRELTDKEKAEAGL